MKHLTALFCLASLAASTAPAAIIYSDDFSGGATKLFGTAPDVRPGSQVWFGPDSTAISANGTTGSATAWLPVTVAPNQVYELTAVVSIAPLSTSTAWFALGFSALGDSSTSMHLNTSGSRDWLLLRQNGNWAAFAGPGTGTSLGSSSTAPFLSALGSPATLKLVLTTGSAYTLDGYINGTQLDLNGAAAGNTLTHTINPPVVAVGFGASNFTADINSFTFTVVPEPASLAMLLLGGALVSCSRRRQA